MRAINSLCVTRDLLSLASLRFPRGGKTFRGTGFDNTHRAFFDGLVGAKYRVPGPSYPLPLPSTLHIKHYIIVTL